MPQLKPRQPTPELDVALIGGGRWRLSEQTPDQFTLIVAYRGLHCPICRPYLSDLHRNLEAFGERGVSVLAVSTDTEERASQASDEWKVPDLTIGYGMSLDTARDWGLYISTSRGKTSSGVVEPDHFSEPGLFLVRPDGTLYAAAYQTMPFARPHFKELLSALDFIIANDYPARGEA